MFFLKKLAGIALFRNPKFLAVIGVFFLCLISTNVYQFMKIENLKSELKLANAETTIVVREIEVEVERSKKETLSEVIALLSKREEQLSSQEKELVDMFKKNAETKVVFRNEQKLAAIPEKQEVFNSNINILFECNAYQRGAIENISDEAKEICD